MYTDVGHGGSSNRDSWKYTYKGSDLLPHAVKLVEYYAKVLHDQREKMADLMKDHTKSVANKKVETCRTLIANAGEKHEKCVVFAHEFKRDPNKEYHLATGDVVFFGIAGQRAEIVDENED